MVSLLADVSLQFSLLHTIVMTVLYVLYGLVHYRLYASVQHCLRGMPKLRAMESSTVLPTSQNECIPYWLSGVHYSNGTINSLESCKKATRYLLTVLVIATISNLITIFRRLVERSIKTALSRAHR